MRIKLYVINSSHLKCVSSSENTHLTLMFFPYVLLSKNTVGEMNSSVCGPFVYLFFKGIQHDD